MQLARAILLAAALGAAAAHAPPHKLARFGTSAAVLAPAPGYSVTVSPSSGLRDGDTVRVTYTSASPGAGDLVLAYSPLPSPLNASAPVEWFPATVDPAYLTTGTGVVPARLVNLRAAYTFALATGPVARPVARALSAPVTFANPNEPRAARLAVTGVPTEMRVSWTSAVATAHPAVALDGGAPQAAQSYTWAAADMCGAPATTVGFRDPGYVHTAVLAGLTPGRAYTYTVGDDTGRLGPYTFTQPSPSAFPFYVSAVGDMGGNTLDGSEEEQPFPPAPNTTRLIARDVAAGKSHAMLHVGDLSYARGYEASWGFFTDILATANVITPVVPYGTNLGNHGASIDHAAQRDCPLSRRDLRRAARLPLFRSPPPRPLSPPHSARPLARAGLSGLGAGAGVAVGHRQRRRVRRADIHALPDATSRHHCRLPLALLRLRQHPLHHHEHGAPLPCGLSTVQLPAG